MYTRQVCSWEIQDLCAWWICGRCGLYAADASVHTDRGPDLSGRGTVRYDPGILFQGNTRKKNFQDGAYPPSF